MKSKKLVDAYKSATSPPARVVWIEMPTQMSSICGKMSPPARVVWIEMMMNAENSAFNPKSPPARVVWIEMALSNRCFALAESPPARVVWIEMMFAMYAFPDFIVATREGGVD